MMMEIGKLQYGARVANAREYGNHPPAKCLRRFYKNLINYGKGKRLYYSWLIIDHESFSLYMRQGDRSDTMAAFSESTAKVDTLKEIFCHNIVCGTITWNDYYVILDTVSPDSHICITRAYKILQNIQQQQNIPEDSAGYLMKEILIGRKKHLPFAAVCIQEDFVSFNKGLYKSIRELNRDSILNLYFDNTETLKKKLPDDELYSLMLALYQKKIVMLKADIGGDWVYEMFPDKFVCDDKFKFPKIKGE